MTEDKRESAVYGLVREFSTFCLYSCVAALAFIGLVAVLGLTTFGPEVWTHIAGADGASLSERFDHYLKYLAIILASYVLYRALGKAELVARNLPRVSRGESADLCDERDYHPSEPDR